jgi:cytochrome c peroxidase
MSRGPNVLSLGWGALAATCVSMAAWSWVSITAGCRPADDDEQHLEQRSTANTEAAVLGSDELLAGIPGEGSLTRRQIETYLADPRNHEAIKPQLPLGMQTADELIEVPSDNPLTRAKIELGRQLFFDRRLSGHGQLACSDCHQPLRSFAADLIGHERLREPPAVFNRIFSSHQFWDGRATSLEEQLKLAIENPDEMNSTADAAVARIAAIEGYRLQFERIFGHVDMDNIGRAIASFERAIVTGPSSWDFHQLQAELRQKDPQSLTDEDRRHLLAADAALERAPVSHSALRGAELFLSERLSCSRCHSGPNLSDEQFHNVGSHGLPPSRPVPGEPEIRPRRNSDDGRMNVTRDPSDRGKFKTPTLRNIARTSPYLHDGRFLSLPPAVDFFLRGGDDEEESELELVELTAEERIDLLAFLQALNSPLPKVEDRRLPE